jgi:hypothetical protein
MRKILAGMRWGIITFVLPIICSSSLPAVGMDIELEPKCRAAAEKLVDKLTAMPDQTATYHIAKLEGVSKRTGKSVRFICVSHRQKAWAELVQIFEDRSALMAGYHPSKIESCTNDWSAATSKQEFGKFMRDCLGAAKIAASPSNSPVRSAQPIPKSDNAAAMLKKADLIGHWANTCSQAEGMHIFFYITDKGEAYSRAYFYKTDSSKTAFSPAKISRVQIQPPDEIKITRTMPSLTGETVYRRVDQKLRIIHITTNGEVTLANGRLLANGEEPRPIERCSTEIPREVFNEPSTQVAQPDEDRFKKLPNWNAYCYADSMAFSGQKVIRAQLAALETMSIPPEYFIDQQLLQGMLNYVKRKTLEYCNEQLKAGKVTDFNNQKLSSLPYGLEVNARAHNTWGFLASTPNASSPWTINGNPIAQANAIQQQERQRQEAELARQQEAQRQEAAAAAARLQSAGSTTGIEGQWYSQKHCAFMIITKDGPVHQVEHHSPDGIRRAAGAYKDNQLPITTTFGSLNIVYLQSSNELLFDNDRWTRMPPGFQNCVYQDLPNR